MFDETPDEIIERRTGSGHKFIAACGVGLNSVAGLILLRAKDEVPDAILFADTGGEKQATYDYIAVLQDWLASVKFPPLTILKRDLKHERQKNEKKYNTLEEECIVKKMLPSIAYYRRSCSMKWKHEPQEKWARNRKEFTDQWNMGRLVVKAIFYDAGESHRVKIASNERYQYWHPLFAVGWDRQQ